MNERMNFTLRDLFWVILSIALAFGWFVDHKQLSDQATSQKESDETKLRRMDRLFELVDRENRKLRSQLP